MTLVESSATRPDMSLIGFVPRDNANVGDTYDTTGDHEGTAALPRLRT
jgi:hypothetical protein